MTDTWMIEDEVGVETLDRAQEVGVSPADLGEPFEPPHGPLAVRLHDLFVHNNKKWLSFLGGADVRVDMLVVQGNLLDNDPTAFYTPTTARFPDVGDKSMLPLDDNGLLAYFGTPRHFIDISLLVSRDAKDSDDLLALLQTAGQSDITSAVGTLVQLAASGGAAIAVKGALTAAATLAGLAYQLVRSISGTTIGMYRGNRLEHPHGFGIGRNPEGTESYRRNDLSFWFEVLEAKAASND